MRLVSKMASPQVRFGMIEIQSKISQDLFYA